MKSALKVAAVFAAGFGASILLSKRMEESDFVRNLHGLVPQITNWWNGNGEWFTRKEIDVCAIEVPPIIGVIGVIAIIVLAGIVIFKIKISKPEK